jgi:DNA-binding response OmpR family regulator
VNPHNPATERSEADAPGVVLVVEDNVDVAESTIAVLRAFGWTAEHAPDAEAALDMLDAGRIDPDVVLADIAMPGEFDGAQLAVHLRSTRPGLRIVLMTGRITEVHRATADGEGFVLLPKPCAPSELLAALSGRR